MAARKKGSRIALVVPGASPLGGRPALARLWRESLDFRESIFMQPLPSLALLTLAGHTPPGFELRYLDERVGARPGDYDCDVAAITSVTCQAPRAYALASGFRRRGARVVLGGPHPTALPAEAGRHADTVITGEAEGYWELFLEDLLSGRTKKRYSPATKGYCNMRAAKAPRYDLLSPRRYRTVPLQVGRGCPMDCAFCSVEAVHGKTYRHKELKQVVEEISLIKRLWRGAPLRLFFADDNLHFSGRFMGRLLEAVSRLKVEWVAQADLGTGLSPRLLRRMAEAGCRRLLVGFEGADREDGGSRRTGGRKERASLECGKLIQEIQSCGIGVSGMFIVGRDSERPHVFRQLRDFAAANSLTDAQVAIQTPLPGTRLFRRLRREGRLLSPQEWSKFNFFNVVYRPRHISAARLLRGQTQLYRQIYGPGISRPSPG